MVLSTHLAPLPPGSYETKLVLFQTKQNVLYLSNFLDSTGGSLVVLPGPREGIRRKEEEERRRKTDEGQIIGILVLLRVTA